VIDSESHLLDLADYRLEICLLEDLALEVLEKGYPCLVEDGPASSLYEMIYVDILSECGLSQFRQPYVEFQWYGVQ
jgi:hypothetical protein